MLKKTVIVTLCAAALAGCQTVQENPNATGGALIGAAGGAALGTLAGGDDRRNALVGAGIGLLAGGAVGAYLDQQERELQQHLVGTGARVYRQGPGLVVLLPGNVTFASGSSDINQAFYGPLNDVAGTLLNYPKSFIDVIGHTDNVGGAEFNQRLSEDRADSVAGFLRASGIYAGRVAVFGMGETQPVASNATAEGRAQNRRVELVIIPAQDG